ncbi:MAG: family 43 glycosylhydrolase [Lachnospiraceae bacterium]|nr:family 43 glycosylhydrolase [Lachnospiraceae bacterium]
MREINPLTRMDYPDPDVIRVGDAYYMVSTTMYFMPGGVILRSYDLAHWEIASYIFSSLDGTPAERLENGQNCYGKGMWAASLRCHDGTFYVVFVSHGQENTHLFTARSVEGPWEHRRIEGYFHDCSLYFAEDGRKFLVSGNTEIRLTELRDDMSGPKEGGVDKVIVRDDREKVFLGYEGAHLYNIDGRFVLTLIHWPKATSRRTEAVFVSDTLDGEYVGRDAFWDDGGYCGQGIAQGGLVDTPDGRWYAVLFRDSGAIGRIPVLVPVTWQDGWPCYGEYVDGQWRLPEDVPVESTRPEHVYEPLFASDRFEADGSKERTLKPQWQWNHVPDNERWSILPEGGLAITTGAACVNPLWARNTLTQRMRWPDCEAEVTVDASGLSDGDRAGMCALQGCYCMVCVAKEDGRYYLEIVGKKEPTPGFGIGCNDTEAPEVMFREELDGPVATVGIRGDFAEMKDIVTCFVRRNGAAVTIGEPHRMYFRLDHFTGARFALCAWSEKRPGGTAVFREFVYR